MSIVMPEHLKPSGEWKVVQVADAFDVEQGLSDKPCFRIYGPGGIDGVYWGWTTPRLALRAFCEYYYDITPTPVEVTKYFT